MAIDSREKRQAMLYFNRRHAVAVTPNASKDQEWRQEILRGYPGIAWGEAVEVVLTVKQPKLALRMGM